MINIVSLIPRHGTASGSGKVLRNLLKGLDEIGYPYVLNRDPGACRRLWIHNDVFALPALARTDALAVLGPNLFVMPSDVPRALPLSRALYLQPSEWVAKLWRRTGFDICPIRVWPVGIATDVFRPSGPPRAAGRVLVYHKRRHPDELTRIAETLERRRLPYRLLVYGRYSEEEYRASLAETSFAIWHGRHESQGIALQEALACDVPVLVCDATSLGQAWGDDYRFDSALFDFPTTSAPYFDDRCGLKITGLEHLERAIERMRDELSSFRPREYVLERLSLAGQARAFVALWEHWGLTYDEGLGERARSEAVLRHSPIDVLSVKVARRFGPKIS